MVLVTVKANEGQGRFRSSALTNTGCVRKLNRDAILERSKVGLWALADGMGGDQSSGIGAAIIVRALAQLDTFDSAFNARRAVRGALTKVNLQLLTRALEERLENVGASVVALLARDDSYACLWTGTSRGYVFRSGKLMRLSRDHTRAQELMDAGQLTREQAAQQPDLQQATRAIGANTRLDIEATNGDLRTGDRFLLCSDGLSVVGEADIALALALASPQQAASRLIEDALEAGAPDNVSVIVVDTMAD
ncbi:MAG: serine/threonine-protein phosphatase [Hyphomonadaceae bacterium]|nr:serine/threonine-protein phosphatase [Hyphomonadaceae bacterium]